MEDPLCLKVYLNELTKSSSSKTKKDAIETLLKIHRNILQDADNIQYRKIKIQNPAFYNKVWSLNACRGFVLKCGWLEVSTAEGDMLIFQHDEDLHKIVQVLLEERLVVPKLNEWEEETKKENLNVSEQRNEDLRRKAAIQRQKELAEFQKDKKYREELSKNVKAQIAEDREKRRQIFTKPVVANKLGKRFPDKSLKPKPSTSSTERRLGD